MGAVPITQRLLPKGRAYGRPGYALMPTSVTIHNTANERAGADAEMHAKYLEAGRGLSWHYTVDADSIVQHLLTNEQGWHAGTNAGNTTSIGIEICEYPQTDEGRALQAAATDNGAWLAAKLMGEIASIQKVVTHKSWSGKECPRDILPRWAEFLALVEAYRTGTPASAPAPAPAPAPKPPRQVLLRKGSTGGAVRTLQDHLRRQGFDNVAIDGDFGGVTDVEVRAFQNRGGLEVDGVVGDQTWGALVSTLIVRTKQPQVAYAPKRVVAAARTLQVALSAVTDAGLVPDGKFGDNTKRAVLAFQRRAGLEDDGVVGSHTWRALGWS